LSYSLDQITEFSEAREMWASRQKKLTHAFLLQSYRNDSSKVLATHGLLRRISTLSRCSNQVYNLIPPEKTSPTKDERDNAAIFLQAFIINIYGTFDNLARIWVSEMELRHPDGRELSHFQVGLGPKCTYLRESFSDQLQNYLSGLDEWFGYLENYRHALAHRIPLYIPPKRLNDTEAAMHRELESQATNALKNHEFDLHEMLRDQQEQLGTFEPWIMHSFGQAKEDAQPVMFHAQLICDLATVIEVAEKLATELKQLTAN
jgi:hypothetical protein